MKTLVGELPPLSGERSAHPDLRIGYFAQHTVESLKAGTTAIDHLRELAPNASTQAFRDFLGKWNFPGDRAFEVIDSFSGGERARLALALIAWLQPNVLLLDEPTNHLDLEMREALAEALSVFEGAIVMVSHDRHLIGLVCETFWRVADGKVEAFDGDLDEYAAWLRSRPGSESGKAEKPGKDRPRRWSPRRRQRRRRNRARNPIRTSCRRPNRASPPWKRNWPRSRRSWRSRRPTTMAARVRPNWASSRHGCVASSNRRKPNCWRFMRPPDRTIFLKPILALLIGSPLACWPVVRAPPRPQLRPPTRSWPTCARCAARPTPAAW